MLEIKTFPQDMSVFEVNPKNLRECLVSGLFKETVNADGKERVFYTYLTPGLTYNQSCLIVAPPDDVPVEEYLENSFWLEFARKEKIFIHFLKPEGRWNPDGSDADYMN